MKKILNMALVTMALTVTTGCEKDLEVYNDPQGRVDFYFKTSTPKVIDYSFITHGDITKDVIWLDVQGMGFLSDQDRKVSLEQVMVEGEDAKGMENAVEGVHFEMLNTGDVAAESIIPGGEVMGKVGIVVKRDASLETKKVILRVKLKPNEYFQTGDVKRQTRDIYISDMLVEPSNWESYGIHWYICKYTPGVHRFLIDITGEPWDNEYLDKIATDLGYLDFLYGWTRQELARINAEREAGGEGPLMEEDGVTPVELHAAKDE